MAIRIIFCFALGSIPFAVIAMVGSGIDIRKVGSGNPGFNNVLRVSKPRALIALAGDMGKGIVAILVARQGVHSVWELWVFGFAAILGHCYSPFLKFKGGKGVATSAGVMLVLYWLFAVISLVFFVAVRLFCGKKLKLKEAGAVASLSSWVLFVLLMLFFRTPVDAISAAVIAAFLFWRHKKNLAGLSVKREAATVRG
ncbi:MAG: glycerol-3-phosphate acyltransferase [Acidobacteriota bacterium]|nr:glycerol-3-phosphate acyltransferase [Acidobacteriota bacterium]